MSVYSARATSATNVKLTSHPAAGRVLRQIYGADFLLEYEREHLDDVVVVQNYRIATPLVPLIRCVGVGKAYGRDDSGLGLTQRGVRGAPHHRMKYSNAV